METDFLSAQTLSQASSFARPAPGANGLAPAGDPRKAAEDFEAFFIGQFLEAMQSGLETPAPFGGGPGEASWRSFLNDAYAKSMVKAGGVGLADRLTSEIIALQAQETNQWP